MADFTPTIGGVNPISIDSQIEMLKVGEAVTDGDALYFDSSDSKWYVADCLDPDKLAVERIAIDSAAVDEFAAAVKPGAELTLGPTLSAGAIYVLSEDGKICPVADLASLDNVVVIGVGTSTTAFTFEPWVTGRIFA